MLLYEKIYLNLIYDSISCEILYIVPINLILSLKE